MFLACGVGAFAAGIFHVMTHAFFKACLFLGSGSVIHALAGEQDIRRMGGLAQKIPMTYRTFLVATLAIAGVPLFAGFFSKDAILGAVFEAHFEGLPWLPQALWAAALLTAGLTAFYMFRLVSLTFYGEYRGTPEQESHIHESPRTMTVPLIVLAALSVVGGYVGFELVEAGNQIKPFLSPILLPLAAARAGAEHHDARERAPPDGRSVAVAGVGIFARARLVRARAPAASRRGSPSGSRASTERSRTSTTSTRSTTPSSSKASPRAAAASSGTSTRRSWTASPTARAAVTRGLSWVSSVFDQYVVDGLVNGVAELAAGRLPPLPPGGDGARPELRPRHGRRALRDRGGVSLVPMR